LYTRFRGGIFSATGAQNTAPKPSSAIENILFTCLEAVFCAPQALENIVCTFGGGILSAAGAQKAAPTDLGVDLGKST